MTEKDEFSILNEQFSRLQTENFELSETLANVSMMLDDRGWVPEYAHDQGGLDLSQVQEASRQLRELVVGNPLIKRGSKLRSSYVWGRGVSYPNLSSRVTNRMFSPINERFVFSPEAYEELELAAYTDGNVFILGSSDKEFSRIPIQEVTAVMTDPDNAEIVWAVQRSWTRKEAGKAARQMTVWYYTDNYTGRKARSISNGAQEIPVDTSKTMFFHSFNRQVGWTFGVPDALAILAWAKLYREFLENGAIMTKALAQFAYKVSARTRTGVSNAAAKIAVPDTGTNRVGATAAMGSDIDLMPMPKAGAAYDFDGGRPLAAVIASGLEVSIVALLADPGTSGSYGTAATLDAPTVKAMGARQNAWTPLLRKLIRFLGGPNDVEISWPKIETEASHRILQALTMAWEAKIIYPEEYRAGVLEALDINPVSDMPPTLRDFGQDPNTQQSAIRNTTTNTQVIVQDDNNDDNNSDDSIVPAQGRSGSVGSVTDNNDSRDTNDATL